MMAQLIIAGTPPKRAMLVIIDGLHIDAPARLAMPNYNRLMRHGASIAKTCVIVPHHPTHGRYADIHTCSYPNPVMMTGTVFLGANQRMLQHGFRRSAFIANTVAYRSIAQDYQFVIQEHAPDSFSIDQALALLNNDVDFFRIHLQDAGTAGYEAFGAAGNMPYAGNIWHPESPYKLAIEEADRQLGRLIAALEMRGELDRTLLVVTGDHGQSNGGWHPMFDEAGWFTPMVFHGPDLKRGMGFEWADQVDIAPTIASIMRVDVPNEDGGTGRVLSEIGVSSALPLRSESKLLGLNRVLAKHAYLSAELILRGKDNPAYCGQWMLIERDFYGLDRILDWREKKSIDELIQHNTALIIKMEGLLSTTAP